nr:MAG TPA: hypothetical protein [Caudoviricetes sp.]
MCDMRRYTQRRYTQRELRGLVRAGIAADISAWDHVQASALHQAADLVRIGYSRGVYGCNGALLQDRRTGAQYAIIGRTIALFTLI